MLYHGTVSPGWLITARRDMWDHDGTVEQMGQGYSWIDGMRGDNMTAVGLDVADDILDYCVGWAR